MPTFYFKGRDRNGKLRSGERQSVNVDQLSNDLFEEGITPIEIKEIFPRSPLLESLTSLFQNQSAHLNELAIFSRQMELLHKAGVPIITSLKQISTFTRLKKLSSALDGCVEYIEKGEKLSTAMQHYPQVFSKLMISIIQIGENTGHLSEAFGKLHEYLTFESSNIKQIKAAFRYPIFVSVAIVASIIIMSIFVIPTFAHYYANMEINLPWQTKLLIGTSNLFIHYGVFILIFCILSAAIFYRYIQSPQGANQWGRFLIHLPIFGKLIRRLILIRLSQSFGIVLHAGLGITHALTLIKDVIQNAYIRSEISEANDQIERGTVFSQAIKSIELFSPLELQIIQVGEKNGQLAASMDYIGHFHSSEVEFDLKRMNDWIGPILITAISILILIVALGIYLPIWNMINLVH